MIKRCLHTVLKHFPSISQFLRNSRDLLDQSAFAKMTPWGYSVSGHDAMADGSFKPYETKVVRKLRTDLDVLKMFLASLNFAFFP
jgi:hypothetical protein